MMGPVAMDSVEGGSVMIHFVLPSKYEMKKESPKPLDERVVVMEEGGRKYSVVRFSSYFEEGGACPFFPFATVPAPAPPRSPSFEVPAFDRAGDSKEERWRIHAELLRAECNFLRIERDAARQKHFQQSLLEARQLHLLPPVDHQLLLDTWHLLVVHLSSNIGAELLLHVLDGW